MCVGQSTRTAWLFEVASLPCPPLVPAKGPPGQAMARLVRRRRYRQFRACASSNLDPDLRRCLSEQSVAALFGAARAGEIVWKSRSDLPT